MTRWSSVIGEALVGEAPLTAATSAEEEKTAMWRGRLETARNLVCRCPSDLASTISVILPISGQPGEAALLEAFGRRLAAERELAYRSRVGSHSITIAFSNRV